VLGGRERRGGKGGLLAEDAAGVIRLVPPTGTAAEGPGRPSTAPIEDGWVLAEAATPVFSAVGGTTWGRPDRCVLTRELVFVSGGEPSAEDRPPEVDSGTPEHMVLDGVDAGPASAGGGAPDAQVECDGVVELRAPVGEAADKRFGVTGVHRCRAKGASATTASVALGATP